MTSEEKLIIDSKEKLSSLRRNGELGITAFSWGVWFFLCRPLFLLILWIVGFDFIYHHLVELEGLDDFLVFTGYYIFVVLFIYFIFRGWNMYNLYRFRGKDRRSFVRGVSSKDFDKLYKLLPGNAEHLKTSKEIFVDFQRNRKVIFRTQKEGKEIHCKGHLDFI